MKNITTLLTLLAVLASCRQEELWEPPAASDVRLTLSVPETGASDVNFYAYSTYTGGVNGHCYTDSGSSVLDLPLGDYEIYAVANAGRDLGSDISLQQLKSITYTLSDTASVPMSGSEAVCLSGDSEVAVTLKRCTAAVTADISVSETLRNMEIRSVQLKNGSISGLYFPKGDTAQMLCDFPEEYPSQTRSFSGTWTTAENCRGTYASITTQQERNMDNAPEGATYLQINAISGDLTYTYYVFLGENNTSDFNIRRNSDIRLTAVLESEETIDVRMDGDNILVSDDMESEEFPGACLPSSDSHLRFSSLSDNGQTYTATVELIKGDPAAFTIDGGPAPATLNLGDLSAVREYQIGYSPDFVTRSNSALVYSVTTTSASGNAYTKKISRTFCNTLTVFTSYPELGYPKGGTLDPGYGPRFRKSNDTGHYTSFRILCPGDTVVLKASCDDGFVLQGWHEGLDGQSATSDEKHAFALRTCCDTLATRFKRERYYIYTDLSSVDLLCFRSTPLTIREKGAYAVKPGESCTVRGKDLSRQISGWYDDPVLRTEEHLVTCNASYDFTPTENLKLYPQYR